MIERSYHPAIKTAVEFWCDEIFSSVSDEKLEVFRQTLAKLISEVFDLPEGVIEIFTRVPNLEAYATFGKPNKLSKILLYAIKKAKLKPVLLDREISMMISTSRVEVCVENSARQILWKSDR